MRYLAVMEFLQGTVKVNTLPWTGEGGAPGSAAAAAAAAAGSA